MHRADGIDELRTLGRRTNGLVVLLMGIAFSCILLERTAFGPSSTGEHWAYIEAFYASVMLSLLSMVALCGQLLAAARWSAWAAQAAKLLRAQGVSGLGKRRFGIGRNWRRPAWVTSEVVQASTAAASWAGEWAPARFPPIVRAWWAAWVVRMFAGLAIALAIWVVPERSGSDRFVFVAFMLRDLALLTAGPLTIMIVNLVDDSIERALAEDGVEVPPP